MTQGYRLAPGSQLAQSRPANTTTNLIFTATLRTAITSAVFANTTGSAATISLFHDDSGGSEYDQDTALLYAVSVPANTTYILESGLNDDGFTVAPAGQVAIQQGTSAAICCTLYGVVQDAR